VNYYPGVLEKPARNLTDTIYWHRKSIISPQVLQDCLSLTFCLAPLYVHGPRGARTLFFPFIYLLAQEEHYFAPSIARQSNLLTCTSVRTRLTPRGTDAFRPTSVKFSVSTCSLRQPANEDVHIHVLLLNSVGISKTFTE